MLGALNLINKPQTPCLKPKWRISASTLRARTAGGEHDSFLQLQAQAPGRGLQGGRRRAAVALVAHVLPQKRRL